MIQPERIARLHAWHADRLSSGRMGGVQEPQPDRWLHSAVFMGLVPDAALTLCRRELWEPRPMSIECMGVWVCVQAHREHRVVKVRVLYMFPRMFVCVYPCACLVVCLCVYIPRCACVQVPNLYTFRGVCVLRFQISIHSGCVCSQHKRGGQRDGGRGKERLLLIIPPCREKLPHAPPLSPAFIRELTASTSSRSCSSSSSSRKSSSTISFSL